jgi:hypothetical protein
MGKRGTMKTEWIEFKDIDWNRQTIERHIFANGKLIDLTVFSPHGAEHPYCFDRSIIYNMVNGEKIEVRYLEVKP